MFVLAWRYIHLHFFLFHLTHLLLQCFHLDDETKQKEPGLPKGNILASLSLEKYASAQQLSLLD